MREFYLNENRNTVRDYIDVQEVIVTAVRHSLTVIMGGEFSDSDTEHFVKRFAGFAAVETAVDSIVNKTDPIVWLQQVGRGRSQRLIKNILVDLDLFVAQVHLLDEDDTCVLPVNITDWVADFQSRCHAVLTSKEFADELHYLQLGLTYPEAFLSCLELYVRSQITGQELVIQEHLEVIIRRHMFCMLRYWRKYLVSFLSILSERVESFYFDGESAEGVQLVRTLRWLHSEDFIEHMLPYVVTYLGQTLFTARYPESKERSLLPSLLKI